MARRGFTLIEVLVTVAIVATLAAVVVPALISQMSKGDAGRASSDLVAVQRAIQTFASDVRRFPDSLAHLTSPITAAQKDLDAVNYSPSAATKWRGPYLSKSLIDGALSTSFGGTIKPDLTKESLSGTEYVAATIHPVTESDFNKIDQIIDDQASSSTGQLQFTGTATSGTVKFYAVPIH